MWLPERAANGPQQVTERDIPGLNRLFADAFTDRYRRDGMVGVRVPFLGTPAAFPAAPWLLAAALKVPVVLCFGLYRGGGRSELYFEAFADRVELPHRGRQQALQAVVARFAARVGHHVRLAPRNWFNFYDFWA